VRISRDNEVEAKAIADLNKEFADDFAVEVRTKPANVKTIQQR
jgi:hypothetical protein